MAEETEETVKKPARRRKAEEPTPEVSAEIPMLAEELSPEQVEPEKPKKRPPAKKKAAEPEKLGPGEAAVYSAAGERAGKLKLPERIFGEQPNQAVMHQALVRQLANGRQGTADTKTRADVSGGGKKPFRQKGLGRSRHGSTREPSMKGGGTVFGPHPRSFRQEMPRKMRRLALRSALAVKASDGGVSVLDAFPELEAPRTAVIAETLRGIAPDAGSVLLVLPAANELVARSSRNLPWAKTILAANLNLHDLLAFDHVVIAKDALELIEETFG
jgi:large subunit ribosomal protein L4